MDKLDILLTMPEEERTKYNYEMIYAYLAEQMPGLMSKSCAGVCQRQWHS